MNDQFNAQKEILVSLKHEISLLHQQVDYLIRNEKTLGLLDLDVMMNRTHTIYDQLCSINVGNPPADDEEMEINPEMLNALFGIENEEEEEPGTQDEETLAPAEETIEAKEAPGEEEPAPLAAEEPMETAPETTTEELSESLEEELEALEETLEPLEETSKPLEETSETLERTTEPFMEMPEPLKETAENQAEDDFGFIFKMEPLEETDTEQPKEELTEETLTEEPEEEALAEEPLEEEPVSYEDSTQANPLELELFPEEKKTGVYTSGDEIEMVIPHIDLPTLDDADETEEPQNEEPIEEIEEDPNPEEEPFQEEEEPFEDEDAFFEEEPYDDAPAEEAPAEEAIPEAEEPAEEDNYAYEPIIFGNMEEKDDLGFEFESVETLGEKMQHEDDQHTVASMLQNQSVKNLRSSIGINDKFLFVNELFGGSMEKYNRSISNLEDLKTLNGALVYLNELRIELAWNSSNEAYKKLLELVHRKFE